MTMLSAKIKERKLSEYKKTAPLFLYFEDQMISIFLFIYTFMLQFCWKQYLISIYAYTCYKIYGYFTFQLFTYRLSSVAYNATLK